MRLVDLDPQFLRHEGKTFRDVATIAEAQGIRFLCPKCFKANGSANGTHQIICWSRSRGVPDDARPGKGRWSMAGTGYADLTLNADAPSTARSIALQGGCMWHGFITDGLVTDA